MFLDAEKIAINVGIHNFQLKFLTRSQPRMKAPHYFTPTVAIPYLPLWCAVMKESQTFFPCIFTKVIPRPLDPGFLYPEWDALPEKETHVVKGPSKGASTLCRVVFTCTLMSVKDTVMREPTKHKTLSKSVTDWCLTAAPPHTGTVVAHRHVPRTRPGLILTHVQGLRRKAKKPPRGSKLCRPAVHYPPGLGPTLEETLAQRDANIPKNDWEFVMGPRSYSFQRYPEGTIVPPQPIHPRHAAAGLLLAEQLKKNSTRPSILEKKSKKSTLRRVAPAVSAFQTRLTDFFRRPPPGEDVSAVPDRTTTPTAGDSKGATTSGGETPGRRHCPIVLSDTDEPMSSDDYVEPVPEVDRGNRPPATRIQARHPWKCELYSIEPPTPLGTPSPVLSTLPRASRRTHPHDPAVLSS